MTTWLSIVAVARRCEVHVCDVYRAVMECELPSRLAESESGVMTVLDSDADHWAASRRTGRPLRMAREMLAPVSLRAVSDLRSRPTAKAPARHPRAASSRS